MLAARRRILLAVASTLGVFACGSDSTRVRLNSQAAHYDSLSIAAEEDGDVARGAALSVVSQAYQAGIGPVTVQVQDSGALTTYNAAVVRYVFSETPLPGVTEMRDLVLWQEPDGARFIHVSGGADSAAFAAADTVPGSFGEVRWGDSGHEKGGSDGFALLVPMDSGGKCGLANATGTCTFQSFSVSLHAVVKSFLSGTVLVDDEAPPHPLEATSQVVRGVTIATR